MQRGVTDGRKVDQYNIAVSLLQCNGGIDGGGGASGSAFCAEKSEYASFAATARSPRTGGTESRKRFEQGVVATGVVNVLPGAGTHAGDDVSGLRHFAIGEDGDLGRGTNQFDGVDGALRVLRRNMHDDNFGARFLKLAQY